MYFSFWLKPSHLPRGRPRALPVVWPDDDLVALAYGQVLQDNPAAGGAPQLNPGGGLAQGAEGGVIVGDLAVLDLRKNSENYL